MPCRTLRVHAHRFWVVLWPGPSSIGVFGARRNMNVALRLRARISARGGVAEFVRIRKARARLGPNCDQFGYGVISFRSRGSFRLVRYWHRYSPRAGEWGIPFPHRRPLGSATPFFTSAVGIPCGAVRAGLNPHRAGARRNMNVALRLFRARTHFDHLTIKLQFTSFPTTNKGACR